MTASLCAASLGRLQLDTEPYDSPLPSHRSTLRRDSHILAEISEMESTFANQEQVNTNTSSAVFRHRRLYRVLEVYDSVW